MITVINIDYVRMPKYVMQTLVAACAMGSKVQATLTLRDMSGLNLYRAKAVMDALAEGLYTMRYSEVTVHL